MEKIAELLTYLPREMAGMYLGVLRFLVPVLSIALFALCALPLITFRREPEIWGWLNLENGVRYPITHWENVIGRSRSCDVTVKVSTVSRNHAVLTRYDDGSWTVSDIGSKTGTTVNGEPVHICAVEDGDVISVGGVELELQTITPKQEALQYQLRRRGSSFGRAVLSLLILTGIQLAMMLGFAFTERPENFLDIFIGFVGLIAVQWALLIFYAFIRRSSFEVETMAFFLCTLGVAAISTVCPEEVVKQLIALVLGVVTFFLIGWSLRDLERAKAVRYLAVLAGVGFLIVTLLFGRTYYGAKNWIVIGGTSLQPSELSKVCFVFAGASTMDRIMTKRNLFAFIVYSVVICGLLALMNDFGTALIFFCAFLVIAYLRSGSMGTVALAITALGIAGILALKIAPHALARFAVWRHVWEDPYNKGYQQTRALMCIASGGLFGLGPGRGWLQNVFASDSDIVFATICEEWGLLVGLIPVLYIGALGLFTIRAGRTQRSSFYAIGGCTAAAILVIQTILNVLGTVDILPFTGVTLPFLSNGGTSMIGAWGLLAFVKASDTRQNASFAVRLNRGGDADE